MAEGSPKEWKGADCLFAVLWRNFKENDMDRLLLLR
jgi:hypothetical protein